jgi:hypothetical protein
MYAGVQYNANNPTIQKVLLDKNQTHTFIASEDNLFNDTDTYIYGASQISSIGDLAPTYCHYCDISKAIKLIDFKIGSEDPNYASHLTEILFGPNTLLKKIDIRNCRSFKNNPDISGCTSIEEIYAQGSNISNITLPPSGYIRKMYLPSTMVMFKIKNQQFIEDFVMESYSNLQEIIIENTPNLPIADILLAAKGLQRLRLINITWDTNKEDLKTIIDKIKSIKTFDENGYPSESKPIITGMVNVKSIDESLLREINDLFPELMVCVNGIVLCTVTYYNANGEKLAIRTVNQGEDAPDIAKEKEPVMEDTDLYRYKYNGWDKPLTNIQKSCSFVAMYETLYNVRYFVDGQVKHNVFAEYGSNVRDPISTNDMPVPTKESDAQFHYTFADWSEETTYVTAPIDVHAIFSTELRSYEVVFCDEYGAEITRVTCYYGKVPTYQGLTPVKQDVKYPQDYKFLGWIPELAEITGPTTYKANFADSDHILDSWATVNASVANGTYKTKYPLGVLHRVELKDGQLIDVELVAYDNGISKNGRTTALTFMAKNCLKEFMAISNDKDYNKLGWINSPVREELNQNVFNNLFPDDLKKLVVCTINTTRKGGVGLNCNDPIETEDYLWLPSVVQVRKDYYGKDCYAIEGKTFDYFDTDFDSQEIKDRRVRYKYDKTENVHCYLRTPTDNQTIYNYFYIDGRGETSAYTTCSSAKGIIPTFSIGEI